MSRREHYQMNDRMYGPKAGPKNDFPTFTEGDVLITITSSCSYKLHSDHLRRSSGLFDTILDKSHATTLSEEAQKQGNTIRYHLVLAENTDSDAVPDGLYESPTHLLKAVELDKFGKPVTDVTQLEFAAESQVVMAWDQVLGAFYNRPLDIGDDNKDNIDFILELAMEVLKIAEYLQCIKLISPLITNTLLALSQTLHRSIATNSAPWLDFAYRLQSRKLFREALIHGAGCYNTQQVQSAIHSSSLAPSVVTLLEHKASLLRDLSRRLQTQLITWYPEQLQRAKTVGRADRDSIGRASYGNDILTWMALSVFRHWLSQMICNDKTHHAADMGYSFFLLISRGGDNYLDRSVVQSFHDYFPMSQKGEAVLEGRLAEIKGFARELVADALGNASQLEIVGGGWEVGHMCCVVVGEGDYPWENVHSESVAELGQVDGQ
ncbi:hypothetical protein B0A48_15870 [Cryoendolithus antarcticus]|uniref:BTB domain-containing protein n=1 Tax=Cryoendolithus antarcticus TaxID=1507870 RepID=A0A1V8SHU4_9PEZI|nr:hypothetical protein B0A48_15870 [Cryoendolithus antarcticus]